MQGSRAGRGYLQYLGATAPVILLTHDSWKVACLYAGESVHA